MRLLSATTFPTFSPLCPTVNYFPSLNFLEFVFAPINEIPSFFVAVPVTVQLSHLLNASLVTT